MPLDLNNPVDEPAFMEITDAESAAKRARKLRRLSRQESIRRGIEAQSGHYYRFVTHVKVRQYHDEIRFMEKAPPNNTKFDPGFNPTGLSTNSSKIMTYVDDTSQHVLSPDEISEISSGVDLTDHITRKTTSYSRGTIEIHPTTE